MRFINFYFFTFQLRMNLLIEKVTGTMRTVTSNGATESLIESLTTIPSSINADNKYCTT